MDAYLVNTRGFRLYFYTLVVIAPDSPAPGALKQCDIIDPLGQLARLGGVQIVLANESDRTEIEKILQRQDPPAIQRWLDQGLQKGEPLLPDAA